MSDNDKNMGDQYEALGFKYAGTTSRYYGPEQQGLKIKKFSLYKPTDISYSDRTTCLQDEKDKSLI